MMKSLKVRDYMSVDVITFAPTDSVMDAMSVLLSRAYPALLFLAKTAGCWVFCQKWT